MNCIYNPTVDQLGKKIMLFFYIGYYLKYLIQSQN